MKIYVHIIRNPNLNPVTIAPLLQCVMHRFLVVQALTPFQSAIDL